MHASRRNRKRRSHFQNDVFIDWWDKGMQRKYLLHNFYFLTDNAKRTVDIMISHSRLATRRPRHGKERLDARTTVANESIYKETVARGR